MPSNISEHPEIDFIPLEELGYKTLELDDKSVFTGKLEQIQPIISEFTFTNLWMWREYYKFAWKLLDDGNIILISLHNPSKFIAFPVIGDSYNQVFQEFGSITSIFHLPIEIHRVPEEDFHIIKKLQTSIQIIEDRNNWDYVYKREDLVNLEGGMYATIRRKLNKFHREYPITIQTISSDNINLCLRLQEEWCDLRSCSDTPSLDNEDKAIRDILLNIDKLDFTGFMVLYENKVIGYSIGEKLNQNTIITHIEKGSNDYFGLYQALNHIFAEKYAKGFEFINREQDLGALGLRQSKESYHPVKYVKKFIVKIV